MGNKKTRLNKRKNNFIKKYNLAKKQKKPDEFRLVVPQNIEETSSSQMKQADTDFHNYDVTEYNEIQNQFQTDSYHYYVTERDESQGQSQTDSYHYDVMERDERQGQSQTDSYHYDVTEQDEIQAQSQTDSYNNDVSDAECCDYEYLEGDVNKSMQWNEFDECFDYEYLDYEVDLMLNPNSNDLFLDEYLDSEKMNDDIDCKNPENFDSSDAEQCNENDDTYGITGCRIVDIRYLFEQLQALYQHNVQSTCNVKDIFLVRESKKGLKSTFVFKCNKCQFTQSINSVDAQAQSLDMNYASVLGAYAIGIGFYQSEEFFSNLQIPFMSTSTFDKYQKTVQTDLKEVAEHSMRDEMEKEKAAAIEHGEVDCNNTPLLSVKGDGSWPKRSFKTGYNSLSGMACLIGVYTHKVIWRGVRSKYCKKCSNAYAKGIYIDHVCNTNYVGPSTGMEADILLDGFRRSEQDFGVRYHKFIADGDSKAYKAIADARIYTNPTLLVEKIECYLHLYRSGRGRLLNIKKLESGKIEQIIMGIKCAKKHWEEQDISTIDKITNLRKDIVNAPYHVFGDHSKCNDYFCDKEKHKNDVNEVPAMVKSGLIVKTLDGLSRLLHNAGSLLYNMNTNVVEQFNSIICKHIGGKRLNFCGAGSYPGRVDAAVISNNTGRLGSTMLKFKCPNAKVESSLIYILETKRIKLNRGRKLKPKHLAHCYLANKSYLVDENYGTNTCEQRDLQSETIELKKAILIDQLKTRQQERQKIQVETVGQHDNFLWKTYRSEMITSSMFGSICNARAETSYPGIVGSILYSSDKSNKSSKWNKVSKKDILNAMVNEDNAIEQLENSWKVKVIRSGLFIDEMYEFLGATPCGLINDDGLVEIKMPFKAKNSLIKDAIINKHITFWTVNRKRKGEQSQTEILGVNKKHPDYFQVQGQLHVTKRKYCLFMVWTEKDFRIERIERNDSFWKREMEEKLVNFYTNYVLPELVDSRYERNMPIR